MHGSPYIFLYNENTLEGTSLYVRPVTFTRSHIKFSKQLYCSPSANHSWLGLVRMWIKAHDLCKYCEDLPLHVSQHGEGMMVRWNLWISAAGHDSQNAVREAVCRGVAGSRYLLEARNERCAALFYRLRGAEKECGQDWTGECKKCTRLHSDDTKLSIIKQTTVTVSW
jgi:hypothetical protein